MTSASHRHAAWTRNLLASLAVVVCFGLCMLTVWSFRKDLICRDAAAPDQCREESRKRPASPQAALKKIYIASGLLPPNMKDDRSGREADIITEALSLGTGKIPKIQKEQIQFVVQPFGRHWYSYKTDSRFDAVTTVPNFMKNLDGHPSQYYIMYRNGIGTLSRHAPSNASSPTSLDQLKGKRVVSFPGAAQVLPEVRSLKDDFFSLFVERQNQRDHSLMLLNGQVDAVIADAMIFAHYNKSLLREKSLRNRPAPVFTDAFAPTCYRMVFRDAEYRDIFDKGLKEMIEHGRLRKIDDHYTQLSELDVRYVGDDGAPRCQE